MVEHQLGTVAGGCHLRDPNPKMGIQAILQNRVKAKTQALPGL
jgi:hypothetical protein